MCVPRSMNCNTSSIINGLKKNVLRWKETISIAFLDKDGEPIKGCTWKVARQHLTPVWLQTVCLKCPMHAKVGGNLHVVK